MEDKKKEVVVQATPPATTPAQMIQLAVQGGADLEKLEKLLELQERFEANEARKAYNASLVRVHEKISTVTKTKLNPQTHSKYATLDEIITCAKGAYSTEGFAITFYEGQDAPDGYMRICADVTHQLGHKETYHYDVPLDGKGIKGNVNMTPIHAKASSTSYGRRYLMCMIWNIPTGDDDDGNGEQPKGKPEVAPVQAKTEEEAKATMEKAFKREQGRLGDEQFYKILGSYGFTSTSEFTIVEGRAIHAAMTKVKPNGKA